MMRFALRLSLILTLITFLVHGVCLADGYDHKIEAGKLTFQWKTDAENIHIKLSAKTTGWVGVGFNPSKEMKDANIILGYVKKGKVKVTDHFGTTKRQHKADKKLGGKKDITNINGKEENGITEISFTIPLDSGDAKDKPILVDHTHRPNIRRAPKT